MNTNWQTKKLGDICDLQNGYAFKSGDYVKESNTMNFRMSQIRPGGTVDLYNNPRYLPDDFAEIYKNFLLKDGDVVIAMTDLATETKILGIPTIVKANGQNLLLNQRVGKLTNIDKNTISLPYLRYILTSPKVNKYYKSLGRGGLQINITKQDILNVEIPVPPISDQQRIVRILDEAFESIDKAKNIAEKNLQNLKNFFDSYLESVFVEMNDSWEKKKLVNIFQIKPPKKEAGNNLKADDLVSFVPMEDIKIGYKEFTCNKERKLKEVLGSYTYFANGDVLLAKITPCFENGKLGIARNLKNGIGFGSSEYIVFRSNGEVIPDYLYYFLTREQFRKEGSERMLGAVGHKRVSKEFVEGSILQFPKSITEQKTIVSKLDSLSVETKKLDSIYQQKLANLEELKKSILNKAFSGEL